MKFNYSKRNTDPEWMDDPALDPQVLDTAVADINKCNTYLGGYGFTKKAILNIINQNPQKRYRIIDVGCSDGAMLRYLKKELPDHDLELTGIDLSSRSIEKASEKSRGLEGVRFRESDIFKTPLRELKCDIVLVTLTLHHFDEDVILDFLRRFMEMADKAVIINDLHRHPIAYGFFKFLSPIFIRNEISIHDGLISIASGFRRADFNRYARALELNNDRLKWKWSFRYIWILPSHERKN
ncbi:Methyltransferase domain-containing protein [Nonlabens sp. Hel1_33_55]|uniref:methyltransferase domain-containing protein n=1 Tax=Nonlabens sp. Hel1_33_55 TaxID=1336802 RepID=UPI000875D734|nr:methyltransferase domain-containing protein [Nonlabens sp. Hel1_33_55]SCY05018.1 Methyltransferase domain-containing protein [Nonlabens sp. Hel1_33_55]